MKNEAMTISDRAYKKTKVIIYLSFSTPRVLCLAILLVDSEAFQLAVLLHQNDWRATAAAFYSVPASMVFPHPHRTAPTPKRGLAPVGDKLEQYK